jgi:DNA (cytosine-5)-methyltransferase 1
VSKRKKIFAVDMFCGAGGTSTGLAMACSAAGIEVDLLAINHWTIAIETHSAQHPWARHMCASVDHVRPTDAVPGGRLHLLVASPECTHHARARGGRPMNEQSRATAWHVAKWAQELYIDNILIENVREFLEWGPLGANGKPLKSRKGETFRAFVVVLESLGYRVEWRVLNAADYGDPTTRERLFIVARRGGKAIPWPERTHSPAGGRNLFGKTRPYRTAREVIDWKLENPSIFSRKKALAPNTMARILAGLKKFNPQLEPFIVTLRQHVAARSMNEPVPTVTGGGTHLGLCEPFILGQQSGSAPRHVDDPVPTIATKGAIAMVEPFIVPQFGESTPRSVERPLGTVTTTSRGVGLVEPFLVEVAHGVKKGDTQNRRARSIDKPVPTVLCSNRLGIAEPFIVAFDQQSAGDSSIRSADAPLSTITTKARHGVAEPFITKFYRTATSGTSVDEPLDTVTTKDRFGLVMPIVDGKALDIRFRMLQPHELARAQGFPDGYAFQGNKSEIVKQIGNAVPVNLAKSLCAALVADYMPAKRKSNGMAAD